MLGVASTIRLKSRDGITPGLGMELLEEMRRAGVRPDIVSYNTIISACSRSLDWEDAVIVFNDMEHHQCNPDLWTYNAMISVFGRCNMPGKAEKMLEELKRCGFVPDAVTYNSLLYAFAKSGDINKVKALCNEMIRVNVAKDEMAYNTMIHMYGKQGLYDLALEVYRDMKLSGRHPDAITYTILIDTFGKAGKITEAVNTLAEMMDQGMKPTLKIYSALICAYAKIGDREKAEETFALMGKSGVQPDKLAYTVMLDIFLRSHEYDKANYLYDDMIDDGVKPDTSLYELMLKTFKRVNKTDEIERFITDMEEYCGFDAQTICSLLVNSECYDEAAQLLKTSLDREFEIKHEMLLLILGSFSSSGRHCEALELLTIIKQNTTVSNQFITEVMIVMLSNDKQIEAALREYNTSRELSSPKSCRIYEALIACCKEHGRTSEASQIFSDMLFFGVKPTGSIYEHMVHLYCGMGFPETAHSIVLSAENEGIKMQEGLIYLALIESYGKVKLWQHAESAVSTLVQKSSVMDRKIWNALLQAYAASGCYERARAAFNRMMRDGPHPTVDSVNSLLQALITDGRLQELYVVVQELQDMGFKISRSSIIMMLEAFAMAGNIFETKKIYHGMKASGYMPNVHLFRTMIGLLCREKEVAYAEFMVSEMKEAGYSPDISIWNSMLMLYSRIGDFVKFVKVYQRIREDGLEPDEDTYNILIIMYCQNSRPEEGLVLMNEMQREGLEPKLDTYKSLISAFGKQRLVEQAEQLFENMLSKSFKMDRSFYHTMMKIYRDSGFHSKAENLVRVMKEGGIEPNAATMHLLIVSYGNSGLPFEGEKVLQNLKEIDSSITTLPYCSVIDGYLKSREYTMASQKLIEMRTEGVAPDYSVWTCFIRAASLCYQTVEALNLLNVVKDAGFLLPLRILTDKSETLVEEVDDYLKKLSMIPGDASLNFVNALVDLLWCFERRATASWVFQLAMKRNIYHQSIFRVMENDWSADFRKLSACAALVALTLWLDCMQDASLQGCPESPKSVVLITGMAFYNMVSLNKTLKACLWEMGSPFRTSKTRTGLLVAKAHSLKMWLKDSPFCLDLELRDASCLPESNSMELIDGCFMRCAIVPTYKEINEKLGSVSPKKFAKLALLPDTKREKVIKAHIEGSEQRAEKMRQRAEFLRKKRSKMLKKRKYIRQAVLAKREEKRWLLPPKHETDH